VRFLCLSCYKDSGASAVGAQIGVDEEQVARLALQVVGVAERNGVKLPREFGILLKQVGSNLKSKC
jgi:aarF domain-containing kinase